MTEAEWLATTDSTPMLEFLKGTASDRKLRLFACACSRVSWDKSIPLRCQQAVETAERYADGSATVNELNRSHSRAGTAAYSFRARMHGNRLMNRDGPSLAEGRLLFAQQTAHFHKPFLIGRLGWLRRDELLRSVSPNFLRCVFGPMPFRPIIIDPCWMTLTACTLAQGIYADRAFDRLPILADALQDAGCEQPDILSHCRGDGPHVRGCWVVDLLTGRA